MLYNGRLRETLIAMAKLRASGCLYSSQEYRTLSRRPPRIAPSCFSRYPHPHTNWTWSVVYRAPVTVDDGTALHPAGDGYCYAALSH